VESFSSNLSVINDEFNGLEVVIAGAKGLHLAVAFNRRLEDGTLLVMQKSVSESLPVICADQEGNNWDIFGYCTSGPREGEKLSLLSSTVGYYFAFNSIYGGVEIYNGEAANPTISIPESEEWLVDAEYVFVAGSFDAIPSVEEANFEIYRSKDYLSEAFHVALDDRITVVNVNGTIRAYPHNILTRHEVVNDEIDGVPITVSFCPLTATSYCWERGSTSFGVSGMLYNNNLILYDRESESLWSQIMGLSIHGEKIGEHPQAIRTFETTFETFVNLYDFRADVMTLETGYVFSYEGNPYVEYDFYDDFLLAPVIYQDDRLLNKERVLAIVVDSECKVYPLSAFN
jgi:hypothetical protein